MKKPPWLEHLARHVGEREIPGPKHNPLIVEWGKAAGIGWWNNDEDAWCAVAVNGALAASGLAGTGSALARSFLGFGRELAAPVPGAIVVFPRGPDPVLGHVGIVETVNGDGTVTIVNGNVDDRVKRSVRRIAEILPGGIRWPADAAPPAPPELGDRLLAYASAGPDVAAWQRRLEAMGFGSFAGTGWFGPKTRMATERFQQERGLVVDGVVGPRTLAACDTVLSKDSATGTAATPDHPSPPKPVPAPASETGGAALVRALIGVARALAAFVENLIKGHRT